MRSVLMLGWLLALLAVCATVVGIYLAWPVHVIDVNKAEVIGWGVRAGEPVRVAYAYCKHLPFESVATAAEVRFGGRIIQAEPMPLPQENRYAPLGCHETEIDALTLPISMPIEAYGLQATVRLHYEFRDGLRVTKGEYETTPFIVLPPAPESAPPALTPGLLNPQ